MKKYNLFLICGMFAVMLLTTGCDEISNPNNFIPDPPGTVRVSMRSDNYGGTIIRPDLRADSRFWINRSDNFEGFNAEWFFTSVGEVNGLGDLLDIYISGSFANQVAVVPKHGYLAWTLDVMNIRIIWIGIYVIDWLVDASGGIIGAEIQYFLFD